MNAPEVDVAGKQAPFGVISVAADGTVDSANRKAANLLDAPLDELEGRSIGTTFPSSVSDTVPSAFPNPDEPDSVEEYYPDIDRWLEIHLVPRDPGALIYLQDAGYRKKLERQLTDQQTELDRVSGVTELISAILTDLMGASTREAIADTICHHLGESELYTFAWAGERTLGSDDIEIRAMAGSELRTSETIETCIENGDPIPEARVLESGEPMHIQPIGEDEEIPESIRRAAFADGLQSVVAVPLVHADRVYGVIGVYAAEAETLSDRERASFATLGEMAGFAVNAVRQRSMLLADSVVEITVAITDPADPLGDTSARHEASLELAGMIPQEEALLCYVLVTSSPVEPIAETFAARDDIASVRRVATYDVGGTVELALDPETPIGVLSHGGGTVQSAEYEGGRGEIVVELPPKEHVRRFVEPVIETFDAEIIRKREHERPAKTDRAVSNALSDRLTEKQERALRTAFFANYFESPRESSAEDVAEAMDISSPTLLYHLRAGQRKLLDAYFTSGDRPRPRERDA